MPTGDALNRQDGKRELRRLREQRGWSWTDEARAIRDMAQRLGIGRLDAANLSSIRRTIARWESDATASNTPDERYQWVLAHLFAERNGRTDLRPGSEFAQFMSALPALGVTPQRVAELQDAVMSWVEQSGHAPLVGARRSTSYDAESVVEMEQALSVIGARVGRVPFVRTQISLAPLFDFCREIRHSPGALPGADLLVTRCFALAGRLAFELHDDDGARAYYEEAIAHARRLPDSWLLASVYASLAMVSMHRDGHVTGAGRVAERAVKAALAGSSIAARARAFAIRAEVAARRRLERPAIAALDLAQSYVADIPSDDPAGHGFSEARLSGFEGLCELLVGDGVKAVASLEQAADGMLWTNEPVQRSIILADLARGHAQSARPEPEAAVARLHECADLVRRTRGRVAMQRIRQVRRILRTWDGEPFLADLDDHVYAILFD
jgi:transcriptional regulator with XRE-family HTH domain